MDFKIKSYKSYEPIQLNFSGKEIRDKNVVVRECYICNGLYKDKIKLKPRNVKSNYIKIGENKYTFGTLIMEKNKVYRGSVVYSKSAKMLVYISGSVYK